MLQAIRLDKTRISDPSKSRELREMPPKCRRSTMDDEKSSGKWPVGPQWSCGPCNTPRSTMDRDRKSGLGTHALARAGLHSHARPLGLRSRSPVHVLGYTVRLGCTAVRSPSASTTLWIVPSSFVHFSFVWISFGLFLDSLDSACHLRSHCRLIMDRILRHQILIISISTQNWPP